MDLRTILTVKTILAEGSYRKAAQRLNYTQSAITFQVRQLENELSLKLFERVGRRMALTQAGRDIMPHLETIIASMRQISRYSGERSLRGELRIGIAESLLTYRMQSVIRAFVEQAPDVKISLCSLNCHDIQSALLAGSMDMGVYYDIGGFLETMVVRKLCVFPTALVVSPLLPKELRDFTTPGQQKDLSFVINEPRSKYREIMENYLRSRNILVRNTIELWSVEAIKRSVASNLGFSFLPRFAVEEELRQGTLQETETAVPEKHITAICVHHKNKWQSPAMELFAGLLASSNAFRAA